MLFSEQVERMKILITNFLSAGWTVTTDPDTGRETLTTEHVATYCGYKISPCENVVSFFIKNKY